jgi:nitroreductase
MACKSGADSHSLICPEPRLHSAPLKPRPGHGMILLSTMNVLEAIKARQSIRAFQPREIEADKLEILLQAANQAASAANLQAYQIYIVRNQGTKDALAMAAAGQKFLATAPIVLVFATDPTRSAAKFGSRGEQVYSMQDTCAAVCNAMLAAVELGLGTCWVDAVDETAAGKAINLPPDQRAAILLPVGYPAEAPARTSRRTLSDLVIDRGR